MILVSDDNTNFREILGGELRRIVGDISPGEDFPFESFSFVPQTARYVKVVGTSHYRQPERPITNPSPGGGLNEIRIFAN